MGFPLTGHGRSQNVQDEPLPRHWHISRPNMDNAALHGRGCPSSRPRHKLHWAPVRCWHRVSMYAPFIRCNQANKTLIINSTVGLGYLKFLAPPEWILREIESRLNLLGRLPHYVSIDQKTYGRFGVLPTSASSSTSTPLSIIGSTQRLGP